MTETKINYKYQQVTEVTNDRHQRMALLTWRLFGQTNDGKELLKLWSEEYLLLQPVVSERFRTMWGDHYVGIREGQNEFIRGIHNLTEHWDQQVEEPKSHG